MQYRGKTDWMTMVSMLTGIVVPAYIAVAYNFPLLSLASVLAAAMLFGIRYPQRYLTTAEALIIKSGLTTRLITYDRIKSVKPAPNGRIVIDYGIGSTLVAPEKPAEFTDDLAAHVPHLKRRGDELAG